MDDDFSSVLLKSIRALSNSPLLLIVGVLVGILAVPGLVVYGKFGELVSTLASNYMLIVLPLLVMPFITGGALGYALQVREKGASSLKTFLASAQKYYVKLVLGAAAAFLIYYMLLFGLLVIVGGALAGDVLIGSLLALASAALAFLCLMAIEFYDVSIVAEGTTVAQSFSNSVAFVRRNLASAVFLFIILIIAKFFVQMPLMFRMMGEFMTNSTYMNMTYLNDTFNSTLLTTPVTFGAPSLVMVAILQSIIQGFVFAFITLYKTHFYLGMKSRKKITDFDYDFSDEKKP